MSDETETLTDKEKEALRLLLAGHDAKSSANELGISVHTVNDRLRNARRKMGVSSSREAARILGESEEAAPQNPPQNTAHKSFGITPVGAQMDTADLTNKERGKPFGITWLAGGMLIMSILIAAAIIGVVYNSGDDISGLTPAHPETRASSAETRAQDAESLERAERFLAAVDGGDWAATGDFFLPTETPEQWAQNVRPVREPLGAVTQRRLATVQRASSLPNEPDGDYEVLQFQTDFAARDDLALETVIMMRSEGAWKVTGYFIL